MCILQSATSVSFIFPVCAWEISILLTLRGGWCVYPSPLIATSSAAPARLFNRCLCAPPSERRLLQTPDKPLYSRLTRPQIESAYTCNHMLQPSDRSIPSLTDDICYLYQLRPPCTFEHSIQILCTHSV